MPLAIAWLNVSGENPSGWLNVLGDPQSDADPLLNSWDRFTYHVFKMLLRIFSPHIWMMAWDQLNLSRRLFARRLELREKIAFQAMVGDTLLDIEQQRKKVPSQA